MKMRLLLRVPTLIFFICLVLFTTVKAQNTLVDSLVNRADTSTNDKIRADLLHQAASETWDYNFEKGLAFSERSLEVARAADYKKGIAIALSDIGLFHYFNADYNKAGNYYRAALREAQEEPGAYHSTLYVRYGNLHRESSQFDSARWLYAKAATFVSDSKPTRALALLYHNLGWMDYDLMKYNSARQYFRKALAIRESLRDSLFIAESWKALGAVASSLNDFDSAHWYFQKVNNIAVRFQNPELMIFYHIFQGELQFKKGEFILATQEFTAALDSLTNHDYKRYRAQALQNIGRSFEWQGNYDNALAYFYDALRIQESMGNRLDVANTYSMMGWAFVNQKDFKKAREIAEKCGANFRLINEGFGISDYYTLSGFIAFQENKFTEARKFYDSALTIRRQAQIPTLEANVMNFIAQLLIAQRRYDEAIGYEKKVFEIFQKTGNRNGMAVYYNNMGLIMKAKNNLGEAEQYALLAIREASPIRATKHVMTAYLNLTEIYNTLGKNTEAVHYYKKYIQTSDSLLAAERSSKQAQYNALYNLENREKEIKRLNQENIMQQTILDVQKSQLRFQNTVLVLAIMASILLAALAFTLYRFNSSKTKANRELSRLNEETIEQKEEIQAQSEELMEANETLVRLNDQLFEKTNEIEAQSGELRATNEMITAINRDLDEIVTRRTSQLKEAYKELDTFFYRSSHDFRRPLTTFMGLAEVANVTVKDRNALDLFDKVKETARALDKMLVKLQSISDVGAQQLVYKEVLIHEIFDNVCDSFRDEIQLKGIKTSCKLQLKDSFISYPAMIKIIVENLVENSIQFSMTEDPYVRLSVSQQENSVVMVMEDNGQGVAKEYAGKVFEMYFRGSERSKGNGLGLYIVKKAVEKLNGSIHLETNYGIGSRFTITLPIHKPEAGWSHL